MGTRGFITFVIDGKEKTAYNHASSQPEDLGTDVLAWLRDAVTRPAELTAAIRGLRVVDPEATPSPEEVDRLWRFARGYNARNAKWHWLLHATMGAPALMLEAGVIPGAAHYPAHPQARWGYVIDADALRFEVYRGGQRAPHRRGRFARREATDIDGHVFYPSALAAAWPFGSLPSSEDFLAAAYGGEP